MAKEGIVTDTDEMLKARSTPGLQDADAARTRLQQWFADGGGELPASAEDVRIDKFEIPQSSGMSNITLLFDLHWRDGGEDFSRSCVARVQPDPSHGKLVFEEYDMSLQYRCMDLLKGKAPVPVMLGLEMDASVLGMPFYIMEKLDGVVPPDIPPLHMAGWVKEECSPAERENLWWKGIEAMCQVHAVDWRSGGFEFLDRPERGDTALDQLLHTWDRYLQWAPDGLPHPEYERCLQWLYDNQPQKERYGLCWGDSRLGNTMYTPDRKEVLAALDWEMAGLGDQVRDLAWWCFLDYSMTEPLGIPRLEGFPGEEETLKFWEKRTGQDGSAFHYYRLATAFYFGVIMTRTSICSGAEDPVGANFMTPVMVECLNRMGG